MLTTLNYWFVTAVQLIPLLLVFFSCFIFSSLLHFIVIICPKAECRFVKPLQHFLRKSRLSEWSFRASSSMLFYRQTWSASRLSWRSWTCSVSICNNSLRNFFISDIRCSAAGSICSDADEDHARWWVSSRSDRSLWRATFHCVLQQKLIWTLSKLRLWSSHVQDL